MRPSLPAARWRCQPGRCQLSQRSCAGVARLKPRPLVGQASCAQARRHLPRRPGQAPASCTRAPASTASALSVAAAQMARACLSPVSCFSNGSMQEPGDEGGNPMEQLVALVGGHEGPVARALQQGGEAFDDATLQRWLVAKKNNPEEAARALAEHAHWRAGFVPNGKIAQAEVQGRLDEGIAHMLGFDLEGRPVVYIVGQAIVWRFFSDNELVKRFLCYVLDTAIACMEPARQASGKITVVFDLTGFGMKNADPHLLPTMFSLLEKEYPERLGMAIIYDAPTIFWGLWQAAQSFIDPVTSQKIKFLYGEEGKQEMGNMLATEVIPASLGGEAAPVRIEQAYERFKQH